MKITFTRRQRCREGSALLIPVSMYGNSSYEFDLIDGIFTLDFNAEIFASFEKSKMLWEGSVVECYKPRHYDVVQVLCRPSELVW